MLTLKSIDEITLFSKEARCQSCFILQMLHYITDCYVLQDGKFVRMEIPEVPDCHLVERIFNGAELVDDDYAAFVGCEVFTPAITWKGVKKNFVDIIERMREFVSLSTGITPSNETLYQAVISIKNRTIVSLKGKVSLNLKDQFLAEYYNYGLFKKVRSTVVAESGL